MSLYPIFFRNQSEEAIFEGFTEVVFSNNTFISEGKIGKYILHARQIRTVLQNL